MEQLSPVKSGRSSGLTVKGLHKRFGGIRVFEDIGFTLSAGEILGVIGPNGAGKTTLINVISGQLMATQGSIFLDDDDLSDTPFHTRSHRGLVRSFQQTNTFKTGTVQENIHRALLFSRKSKGDGIQRLPILLKQFGLTERLDQPSEKLPYGMQKLLGLLMVYATSPRIMLLDEPAAGLENSERHMVDELVRDAMMHLGCGVLIVEHDMDLVRRLCPTIMVLDGGHILAKGSPEEVLSRADVIRAYLGTAEEEVDTAC